MQNLPRLTLQTMQKEINNEPIQDVGCEASWMECTHIEVFQNKNWFSLAEKTTQQHTNLQCLLLKCTLALLTPSPHFQGLTLYVQTLAPNLVQLQASSFKLSSPNTQTPGESTSALATLKLLAHNKSPLKRKMQLKHNFKQSKTRQTTIRQSFASNILSSPLLLSLFQMRMRRSEKGCGVVAGAVRVYPWRPRGVLPMATAHAVVSLATLHVA